MHGMNASAVGGPPVGPPYLVAVLISVRLTAVAGVLAVVGGLMWWFTPMPNAAGECPACGYDLSGLAEGAACPECGTGARSVRSAPAEPLIAGLEGRVS